MIRFAIAAGILILSACYARADPATKNGWDIVKTTDAMRKVNTIAACRKSSDSVKPGFPYKSGPAIFCVTEDDPRGAPPFRSMLTMSAGLFDCPVACTVNARFDDGPVESFQAYSTSTFDSLIFKNDIGFTLSFLMAKSVIVEFPIYTAGRQQATFQSGGITLPLKDFAASN